MIKMRDSNGENVMNSNGEKVIEGYNNSQIDSNNDSSDSSVSKGDNKVPNKVPNIVPKIDSSGKYQSCQKSDSNGKESHNDSRSDTLETSKDLVDLTNDSVIKEKSCQKDNITNKIEVIKSVKSVKNESVINNKIEVNMSKKKSEISNGEKGSSKTKDSIMRYLVSDHRNVRTPETVS